MLTEALPTTTLPPVKPKEFDWLVTLQELANGRPYTGEEQINLEARAGMWPTCACGQLCRSLPRVTPDGRPEDDILYAYGRGFYDAIKLENWRKALYLFNQIEIRTAYLLNEQRIILDSLQSAG